MCKNAPYQFLGFSGKTTEYARSTVTDDGPLERLTQMIPDLVSISSEAQTIGLHVSEGGECVKKSSVSLLREQMDHWRPNDDPVRPNQS